MAIRPIFVPDLSGLPFVQEVLLDFNWFPGFSKVQAQRSVASLHDAASLRGISPVLEISSKSTLSLGVSLSAFNLLSDFNGRERMSVECAFQGSKVFEKGGPYIDLYSASSRDAKTDERLRNSGELIAFNFTGEDFPTKPVTLFYDWLYITALWQNPELSEPLSTYRGFSDIAFNPERSFNCQARSAALFLSLKNLGEIERAVKDKDYYIRLLSGQRRNDLSVASQAKQLGLEL